MRTYLRECGVAIRLTLLIMLLTGIIYPLVVTAVAQAVFHDRANGSLVERDGAVVGSRLIGQSFTSDQYFHGRPSDTLSVPSDPSQTAVPQPYNAANSGAANLGPTNQALILAVQSNSDALRCREGLPPGPATLVTPSPAPSAVPAASTAPCAHVSKPAQELPVDAVTGSGSGLDPDISVAYAELQIPRIATARTLPGDQVRKLVQDQILDRQFGILGERRANVLDLNLALDRLGH
ncbi:MAG: potassium-transporting ATPase subunit C [Dehalococcoidia bacterium]